MSEVHWLRERFLRGPRVEPLPVWQYVEPELAVADPLREAWRKAARAMSDELDRQFLQAASDRFMEAVLGPRELWPVAQLPVRDGEPPAGLPVCWTQWWIWPSSGPRSSWGAAKRGGKR